MKNLLTTCAFVMVFLWELGLTKLVKKVKILKKWKYGSWFLGFCGVLLGLKEWVWCYWRIIHQ